MIFAALNEAADRGELILWDNALCRYHRRKDGRVTVREILVLPDARRLGVGRRLVGEVQRRNPGASLLARCPATTADGPVRTANVFWRKRGFTLQGARDGINT